MLLFAGSDGSAAGAGDHDPLRVAEALVAPLGLPSPASCISRCVLCLMHTSFKVHAACYHMTSSLEAMIVEAAVAPVRLSIRTSCLFRCAWYSESSCTTEGYCQLLTWQTMRESSPTGAGDHDPLRVAEALVAPLGLPSPTPCISRCACLSSECV